MMLGQAGAGPTHRFLGPIQTVGMCLHSTRRQGGKQIQTHCGEEMLVGVVFGQIGVDG